MAGMQGGEVGAGARGAEAEADFIFQVVIVGDARVGKTSVLHSMVAGVAGAAGTGEATDVQGVVRISRRLAYACVTVCAGTSPPQGLAPRSLMQTARAVGGRCADGTSLA